ncbi:MAG: immune inhibitor A, partial [Anaerolineae bacterium]|nr:immune inhibitor A [Anaerolineae bacterium]
LNDANVEDGRYQYSNYEAAPKIEATQVVDECPVELNNQTVHQYAADYIEINCRGNYTISFQGNSETRLVPADAHSGKYMFWSNKGDESDMRLTRIFDLSQVDGKVDLEYWTWFDLEKDFDYVYVEVSNDNGETWNIIRTPQGSDEDPSGNSYGWAYNGKSGGWVKESVNLSSYAGQKIMVRFEYITDAAVNGEGFLLDDISLPALDYHEDFENEASDWEALGFVRVENVLPQTYQLSLITGKGKNARVEKINLSADQTADVEVDLKGNDPAVLIVSGTTRFTRSEAPYSISIK